MRAAPPRRKSFQGKDLVVPIIPLGFAVVVIVIATHVIRPLLSFVRLTVELNLVEPIFVVQVVVMVFHFVSPKKVMSARASLIQTLHINAHGISLAGRAISSIRFRASSRSAKWYL